MNEMSNQGVWPTPNQRLLLLAAAGDEAVAREAWEQWSTTVDIDTLDGGSNRLLPLLYPRLQAWGATHPWLPRLKGIYRRTWYENQLLFHHTADVLGRLHAAGIQTILLKGPALVLHFYRDYGSRPMEDFDILVPAPQATAALAVLQAAGLKPSPHAGKAFKPGFVNAIHSFPFIDATGHDLDLHWHALAEGLSPDADIEFWAGAVPITLEHVTTHVLNPADQLLHLMAHGVHWNPMSPIRWFADALVLLNVTPDLDWPRLLAQTQRRRLALPVHHGLSYLADQLAAPIPRSVLDAVQAMPIAWADRLEYQAHTRPQTENGPLVRLWLSYRRYRRASPQTPLYTRPLGFTRFMRDAWGLDHTWQAPVYAVTQGATRLWQRIAR